MSSAAEVVSRLRSAYNRGVTRPASWRINQLQNLRRCLFENQDRFVAALKTDLRKPEAETKITEFAMVFEDIDLALDNLEAWMKPRTVSKPNLLAWGMDKLIEHPEPFGVVMIISAWNYPVQLSLVPMVGSIAAGNAVLLKPSEVSPSTAQLFEELLPRYLDNSAIAVFNGGVEETTDLLRQRWDKILYTGNSAVGKIIMRAASEFLTPVVLELGGKSPTIVDKTADLYMAARRIMFGKNFNCGQSCIAPDYILVEESVEAGLVQQLKKVIGEMYGDNPQASDSLGRIINERHFRRIRNLIEGSGEILLGGNSDEADLYIAPTIIKVTDPDNSPVMQDEIFGPILPIISVRNLNEAVDFINQRPKPLALYVFSSDQKAIQKFQNETSSGGFVSNDTMVHAACNTLTFGGVGNSGTGGYHGKHSFDCFTHYKPVVIKFPGLESLNAMRLPPWDKSKLSKILWFLGYPSSPVHKSSNLRALLVLFTGVVAAAAVFAFFK